MQLLHHGDGYGPPDVAQLQCHIARTQAGQLPAVRREQAASRLRQLLDVDVHLFRR